MMRRKTVRSLTTGSPRLSRAKHQPINTAGSRYTLPPKSDLKTHETTSYLEVTSLTANESSRRMENTYKMKPDRPFKNHDVELAAQKILEDHLQDKVYDSGTCKSLSQFLSAQILDGIKKLGFSRYKMVAVVSIGSMKERPGMQFGSRCLWNKDTDNFISAKYSNTSLFAVAMVYGLFFD